MNIGIAIKKLRKECVPKLTQAEYAKRIGITQTYLSQIERGHKKPRIEVIEKIAQEFEIPIPVIFWFSIENSDVNISKLECFKLLKPDVDQIINSIF